MLPRVLKPLLHHRADSTVTDYDGEGILARLFPTLSCCDITSMGTVWMSQMVDVIVLLLKAGCDPNLTRDCGWSPSDNCLTPSAWMIWCESLSRAGYDIADVVE